MMAGGLNAGQEIQFAILEVSQARCEAEPQEIAQSKDMIRRAASIHMMLLDCDTGLVAKQTIQNEGCYAFGGGDDRRVERAELIGDVGVELETRGAPVFCVDICRGFTAATGTEELSI